MTLREHNIKMLEELKNAIKTNNLANPLLVSSNIEYINGVKRDKNILYIGQETNGWCETSDIEELEKTYYNFLINNNYNKEFWRFLKLIRGTNSNSFSNVIWSNALICGKNNEIGTPIVTDDLKTCSLENLLYLYNFFKPDMTIIVSGPSDPYYEIIKCFLKNIKSSINGLYPSSKEMLIRDETNNINYTYHPNYLNRKNKFLSISKELNKYYKNR